MIKQERIVLHINVDHFTLYLTKNTDRGGIDHCNAAKTVLDEEVKNSIMAVRVCTGYSELKDLNILGRIEDVDKDGSCGYSCIKLGLDDLSLNKGYMVRTVTELCKEIFEWERINMNFLFGCSMYPTAFKTKESKDLWWQNNVLSSIYKEGTFYENGTSEQKWFDGSLMGPIVAHKYNVDLIVYTATKLPTTTQYLISKNTEFRDELMIVQPRRWLHNAKEK